MTPDIFTALTPFGAVDVEFPEDGGATLDGDAAAARFLVDHIGQCTNAMGMTMTLQNLEPSDFVGFCQPKGSAVRIIPPADFPTDDEADPVLDAVGLSPLERARAASALAHKVEAMATATGIGRARIAGELNAMLAGMTGNIAGPAPGVNVSIYNNDAGAVAGDGAPPEQGKGNKMTTEVDTQVERHEAQARAMLAAGFTTKVAQQRARESATRAFEVVTRAIQSEYLRGDRENTARQAVYFAIPYYPHEWRPKHSAMIRADLPEAAQHIEAAERIVALAAEIKATPLLTTKQDEKSAKERAIAEVHALNPELRAEFEAQAPAIAADYAAYMRRTYEYLQSKFPGGVPADIDTRGPDRQYRNMVQSLSVVCKAVSAPGPTGIRGFDDIRTLVLSETSLANVAEKYGELAAVEWFHKTNAKLGPLVSPVLVNDSGGDVHVKGTRRGKRVEIVQQRIINVSPLGKLFHQFPSRIYVDGKFVNEAAYTAMFKAS